MSARLESVGTPREHPQEEVVKVSTPKSPAVMKRPESPEHPTLFGIQLRFLVLVLLSVQNAGAVLLMRAVRSLPGESDFSTQSAVIMQEAGKGLACIFILLSTEGTLSAAWNNTIEAMKIAVPALLYLMQNNLQYLAVSYLDAATYTVSYQTKIIWTGVLSVLLLKRELPCHKIVGLTLLSIGVATVNLGSGKQTEKTAEKVATTAQRLLGLVEILSAALCSSLAGVYFEKVLKGCKISLWARNLQLAFYSLIIGFGVMYFQEDQREMVATKGFFHGYTAFTWLAIAMNAGGGLLVGAVIKYADAVSKDVSIGSSIVLSTVGSMILFGYSVKSITVLGMAAVIYAVFLYSGTVPLKVRCNDDL